MIFALVYLVAVTVVGTTLVILAAQAARETVRANRATSAALEAALARATQPAMRS